MDYKKLLKNQADWENWYKDFFHIKNPPRYNPDSFPCVGVSYWDETDGNYQFTLVYLSDFN